MMQCVDGTTPIGVLRLFSMAGPDLWHYEDLYLAPEVMGEVAELAGELGVEYARFEPKQHGYPFWYNGLTVGLEYVRGVAKRHYAYTGGKVVLADAKERAALPLPGKIRRRRAVTTGGAKSA